MENKMTVLVVEPERVPYVKEIDPGLQSLQSEVKGWIQAVYPFDDPVALICNDEGKLMRLPLNRALRDDSGQIYDVVAGTFLIVGLSEDNFASLRSELIAKYEKKFKYPEIFIPVGNTIRVLPIIAKQLQKEIGLNLKEVRSSTEKNTQER